MINYFSIAALKKIEEAGVGEILITSVDNEGTWNGLDLELIKQNFL